MLPLSKEYCNSVCEISSPQGESICSGLLEKIEDESIQLKNQEDDILPIVHCDTFVNIHVLSKSLESKSMVGRVYLSTSQMMRLIDVQNLSDFERRDFFRLKIGMETQAYLLKPNTNETIELFPIKVTNLSLSGCFIETRKQLEIGRRFVATFPLTDAKLSFTCQVQRMKKMDDLNNGYGCTFLEPTKRQIDLLCQFIFEKQRELIQKSRNHLDH
ncbi:PilZ domain-containing protein [Caproiciproducens sp. LBM24188]|jgi:hypothetical protein|nr:PilZ domain-containing protein [Oscillospiraceae bacterium]HHV31950.1 PilZ domain-containing protein [Clostridiales bacterium]